VSEYAWHRISERAKVTHARAPHIDERLRREARCGASPAWFAPGNDGWQGEARDLPRCRRCVLLIEKDRLMAQAGREGVAGG
jgi:hypothetical protein